MNIIMLGPPGSGKGTISEKLINKFNYKYICAGDLLRLEKASGSELGKEIAKIIDGGNLVPDKMITEIMLNEISKPKPISQYFLIDGYPRTLRQADDLSKMLNPGIVLWLEVSEEETIRRNLKRGQISNRPDDADEVVIKKRIKNYWDVSSPLKTYYSDKIVSINGEGTKEEVYQRVSLALFDTYTELKEMGDII